MNTAMNAAPSVGAVRITRHLARGHRGFLLSILAAMALGLTAIAVILRLDNGWALAPGDPVSIWHLVAGQVTLWMMFVVGIMLAAVHLPLAIAHGVTRQTYWRGAALLVIIGGVVFAALLLLGYGIEHTLYRFDGIADSLAEPYPITSAGDAARLAGLMYLGYLGFAAAGWLIGLLFYRLNVWLAIVLTAGITVLTVGGQFYHDGDANWQPPAWPGGTGVSLLLLAGTVVAGYLLARTVPVRPKKA